MLKFQETPQSFAFSPHISAFFVVCKDRYRISLAQKLFYRFQCRMMSFLVCVRCVLYAVCARCGLFTLANTCVQTINIVVAAQHCKRNTRSESNYHISTSGAIQHGKNRYFYNLRYRIKRKYLSVWDVAFVSTNVPLSQFSRYSMPFSDSIMQLTPREMLVWRDASGTVYLLVSPTNFDSVEMQLATRMENRTCDKW